MRSFRRGFMSARSRSAGAKIWKHLPFLAGLGAFFYTTLRSDISYANSSGTWNNFTATQKAQTMVNWFVSRLTIGTVPRVFGGNTYGGVKPTFQLGNTLNGVTALGVLALILKHVPFIPQRGKIGRFGVPLIAAGVLGGLFDDPSGQAVSRSPSYVGNNPQATRGAIATGVNTH